MEKKVIKEEPRISGFEYKADGSIPYEVKEDLEWSVGTIKSSSLD